LDEGFAKELELYVIMSPEHQIDETNELLFYTPSSGKKQ
jgi:hypothetical protein